MRALITAALLSAAVPAFADRTVTNSDGDVVRITSEPCPVEVLQVIKEGQRGYYRRAYAVVDGVPYLACWRQDGHRIAVIYEDGEVGDIDLADFTKET